MTGLSQYERQINPELRNAKKTAEAEPKKKGAPLTKWTEQEVQELIELCVIYQGRWNINVLIAQHLPAKTQ